MAISETKLFKLWRTKQGTVPSQGKSPTGLVFSSSSILERRSVASFALAVQCQFTKLHRISNSHIIAEGCSTTWQKLHLFHWQPTNSGSQRHTTVLRPFFWAHPGEPVPEENFWTLWCKGRLTEPDTPTIRLVATPSGPTSAHLHHQPIFYRPDALPAAQPIVSKHWRQLAHLD